MTQPRNIEELFDGLDDVLPTLPDKSGFIIGLRLALTRPDLVRPVLTEITSLSGFTKNRQEEAEETARILFEKVDV